MLESSLGENTMQNCARSVRWLCVFALLLVFGFSVLPLAAQDATGRIIGVVTDPTGAVVPRAKVTVTNVATGTKSETTSCAEGSYPALVAPLAISTVASEATRSR